MNTRDYYDVLKGIMTRYCQADHNIIFVQNISAWCEDQGIPEPDKEKPFKIILRGESGCKMLIRENVPEKIIDERINAMSIRGQVENVAFDRAELLDSNNKKLVYMLLSEYASSLPDIGTNELLADDWAFSEMKKLGFFKQ